jgi:hypothetical protein
MQLINLQAIPNQSLTSLQDNNRYDIRIFEANGCMAVDLTINGNAVLKGSRIVSGSPIIPFTYLFYDDGNFFFACQSEDQIYYDLFGSTQQLYYISHDEMVEIANGQTVL